MQVRQFVVVLVAMGMVFLPVVTEAQQEREPLSKSVVQSTSRELAEVLNRQHSGAEQPGDLARAEVSLRILYEHMEATGQNDAIDNAIRLHRRELASMRVTDELVNSAHARFTEAGVMVTQAEVRSMLTKSVAEMPKFLDNFETLGGIRGFQVKALSRIHARSVRVSRQVAFFSDAHMRPVEAYACENTEGEAGLLAAAFGIAGALGCVACIPIAAGFALGAALIQVLCAPSSSSFGGE